MSSTSEIIIIGSGHNALVAACYLAKAGKKVLVLEKNNYIGGATTSQKVFPDYEAYLSKYSYLISLFPEEIVADLGISLTLLPRKVASYTPYLKGDAHQGLLISNTDQNITKASIMALGANEDDYQGYCEIMEMASQLAELVWESVLHPLKSRSAWKAYFKEKNQESLWTALIEKPIGELLEQKIKSDVLRGVLLTDARIGVFTHAHDKSLLQNITYIYHVIGRKTGEWRVPAGGMGALATALENKAKSLGVVFKTNAEVLEVLHNQAFVSLKMNTGEILSCNTLLINAAMPGFYSKHESELQIGTAFKINLLLQKLPQLKDESIKPEEAFCGTFHINQLYSQQEKAYQDAKGGKLPDPFPCEIYCHTLTDASILSPELVANGYHTLTVFGMDMAYPLFKENNAATKEKVVQKFFEGINTYLKTPIEECLALDSRGAYCIEAKSALDLENEMSMPMGNIFHTPLSWFFTDDEVKVGKWGVETDYPNIYLCGSSAERGGAVSGIPGRNAAMAVMEKEKGKP